MGKLKKIGLVLLVFLLVVIVLNRQVSTHLKIILFITEQFPQIPLKPLGLITPSPIHQQIKLETESGKVIGDLFIPSSPGSKSAVIVAMGVRTQEKDKPLILKFSQSMARLGYVTFWPRLEVLDKGQSLPEEPTTFVASFKYLESLKEVNKERISYAGFSVGSSTALVAAADPAVADQVHALVFFGGQYNIFEYLENLASKSYEADGQRVEWQVADDARNHAKGLLETKEATHTARIFSTKETGEIKKILSQMPEEEKAKLKRYSPQTVEDQFKARLFILHDKSDVYVPFTQSIKLNQAFQDQVEELMITDLFEHVQPNRPLGFLNIKEMSKLYGFLYQVFNFL
ncbi:MAG: hypothetical protein HYW45_02290 [Candidatus Daviesbacteria bacterium]|nr:MAG: hypothetical protein HYW45_02290 [Candidatus Daviesbacteria bacterium]